VSDAGPKATFGNILKIGNTDNPARHYQQMNDDTDAFITG